MPRFNSAPRTHPRLENPAVESPNNRSRICTGVPSDDISDWQSSSGVGSSTLYIFIQCVQKSCSVQDARNLSGQGVVRHCLHLKCHRRLIEMDRSCQIMRWSSGKRVRNGRLSAFFSDVWGKHPFRGAISSNLSPHLGIALAGIPGKCSLLFCSYLFSQGRPQRTASYAPRNPLPHPLTAITSISFSPRPSLHRQLSLPPSRYGQRTKDPQEAQTSD